MNEIMRTDLRFTHKLPIVHLLDELNALKEKLKPAFPDTVIYWLSDDAFFGSLASFTLTELVPQKGFRRFLGFKHIELATFTRETLFRAASLKVLDPRVSQYLTVTDPDALRECASGVANRCCGQKEVSIEIAA